MCKKSLIGWLGCACCFYCLHLNKKRNKLNENYENCIFALLNYAKNYGSFLLNKVFTPEGFFASVLRLLSFNSISEFNNMGIRGSWKMWKSFECNGKCQVLSSNSPYKVAQQSHPTNKIRNNKTKTFRAQISLSFTA